VGGKVRLVKDASSTPGTVVLNLVAGIALTGYYVGFNLPLDATKVQLNSTAMTPGTALSPGTSPAAAKAALPLTGPLKGILVTGQSQKAAGTGAVPGDSTVNAGDVFYTIRLDLTPTGAAGAVFDGAALGAMFNAGIRNKAGSDVAVSTDFAIGKLVRQ
jgi:hypothetical protein